MSKIETLNLGVQTKRKGLGIYSQGLVIMNEVNEVGLWKDQILSKYYSYFTQGKKGGALLN